MSSISNIRTVRPTQPLRVLAAMGVVAVLVGCSSTGSGTGDAANSTPPASGAQPTLSASSSSPSAAVGVLTGEWVGTWERTSEPPGNGTYTLTLTQEGNALSGTLVATGSACLTTQPVIGTVSGDAVTFHVTGGSSTATYEGTVSGNTLSGTGVVTCSAGAGTATWELTKS